MSWNQNGMTEGDLAQMRVGKANDRIDALERRVKALEEHVQQLLALPVVSQPTKKQP